MTLTSVFIREQDGLLTLSTPDDELADEVKVDEGTVLWWRIALSQFGMVQKSMAEALNV